MFVKFIKIYFILPYFILFIANSIIFLVKHKNFDVISKPYDLL